MNFCPHSRLSGECDKCDESVASVFKKALATRLTPRDTRYLTRTQMETLSVMLLAESARKKDKATPAVSYLASVEPERRDGTPRCQNVDRWVKTQKQVQCSLPFDHPSWHVYMDEYGEPWTGTGVV